MKSRKISSSVLLFIGVLGGLPMKSPFSLPLSLLFSLQYMTVCSVSGLACQCVTRLQKSSRPYPRKQIQRPGFGFTEYSQRSLKPIVSGPKLLPALTLSLPSSKSTFSQPSKEKCVIEAVRIGDVTIFHLSEL